MEILKLSAPCKDYIWGGNRLREEYGKVSDADKIAESWELSCHKDGQSVIANGKDKGKTLSEYVAENKNALGTACGRFDEEHISLMYGNIVSDLKQGIILYSVSKLFS